MCHGGVGPPEILVIERDRIPFRISIASTASSREEIVLSIYFVIPDSFSLKTPVENFYLSHKDQRMKENDITLYYSDIEKGFTEIDYSRPLTAKYQFLSSQKKDNRGYILRVRFPNIDFQSFAIFIPPFKINGEQHQFPPIKFKKSEKVILIPLNC